MDFLANIRAFEAALYASGFGGFIVVLRFLLKILRRDVIEISAGHENDIVLERWKELAGRYKEEAAENAKRADAFAEQRNKAIEEVGQLRGEVRALTTHIASLEKQISNMERTVKHLEALLTVCDQCSLGVKVGNSLNDSTS